MLEALSQQAKQEMAAMMIRAMYATFDVDMLEQILAIGQRYISETRQDEVLLMNEALALEIERRKASQ